MKLLDVDVQPTAEAGVTRRTLYKWIEQGLDIGEDFEREYLTAVRLGGKYSIDPNDLFDFLNFREDEGLGSDED